MVFGEYIKQPFAPGTLKKIGNLDISIPVSLVSNHYIYKHMYIEYHLKVFKTF